MSHYAFARGLVVVDKVSAGERSHIDKFERAKEKRDHLLQKVNAYKMENKKLEKELQEKRVPTKAMTRSPEDSEGTMNRLETEKRSSMNTYEELVSCLSQKTTSGGQITDNRLNIWRYGLRISV